MKEREGNREGGREGERDAGWAENRQHGINGFYEDGTEPHALGAAGWRRGLHTERRTSDVQELQSSLGSEGHLFPT